MKRKVLGVLFMIIMLVSIFVFASCSNTDEPSSDEPNEREEQEECQHAFDGWYVKEKSTCTTDGEKRRDYVGDWNLSK